MTPNGSINGQDKSRCSLKSSFQVYFFSIFFKKLMMNIDCDKILEELDDSEDEFRSFIQKQLILQFIQIVFVKC